MQYEQRIIDVILNTIKDNQEYLTQKENLPQLAKLGYMYNALWYGGRMASYDGVIPRIQMDGEEYHQCDDNPKYKIEMCDPENDEIENYIYDAWGMHVSNDPGPGWSEFHRIVTEGEELDPFAAKMLKADKTFDEWVEVLTDPGYRYSSMYPDRRSVADHLLCVIGNGYGFKNGFVIHEASGADQDVTDYGDWKNARFRPDIQAVVDAIVADPEVKTVMEHVDVRVEQYKKEEMEREMKAFGMPYEEWLKTEEGREIAGAVSAEYKPYYPISNYSIITMIDEKSDQSYIKAAIEICEEIFVHEKEENVRPENVEFARKFLAKHR